MSEPTPSTTVHERIRLRRLSKLQYRDPRSYLIQLRKLEHAVAGSPTPERIKTLRTPGLKPERESRDGAIFTVGMSEVLGLPVHIAPVEDEDFDFVARCDDDDTTHYCRIQLKEVVPTALNETSSVQGIIDGLTKYADLGDITVAIKLNREDHFDPVEVTIPDAMNVGELWVFGALTPDQSEFGIWGNFVEGPTNVSGLRFKYPE